MQLSFSPHSCNRSEKNEACNKFNRVSHFTQVTQIRQNWCWNLPSSFSHYIRIKKSLQRFTWVVVRWLSCMANGQQKFMRLMEKSNHCVSLKRRSYARAGVDNNKRMQWKYDKWSLPIRRNCVTSGSSIMICWINKISKIEAIKEQVLNYVEQTIAQYCLNSLRRMWDGIFWEDFIWYDSWPYS